MHIALQKIVHLKSKIKLEDIYNGFVVTIIAIILILAFIALHRPITVKQFENVVQLSAQANYPATQEMALLLMQQPQIPYAQYFKLMQAHHLEMTQAYQLPPLQAEQ
ncbi:hypothetical protein E0H88_09280 [Acinetobacter sp. ANC 4216]|uniref:hypothetical protein n=1 Tax=Acinetobacter sp. ANC 4216 TaxID=2529840 RepID=UPI001038FD24|nr:hypothetical protein [Acinetobacter sp. ANC 4216]TCB70035.1 hypothetical protein E0H88_09280 [Acinetobacter sp. ANC 4216]